MAHNIFDTSYEDYNNYHDNFMGNSILNNNPVGNLSKELEANVGTIFKEKKNLKKRKPRPDWTTSNKSFLDLYQDLKKLGIVNNKFFLALYDQDLRGINPFMPKLPLDMQLKVFFECLINPWYYLREICRIPADGTPIIPGGGIQYQINRGTCASWYCFLNGIDNYLSLPRQQGKTQDSCAKINYAFHFGCISSTFMLFNKDLEQSKQNLYRIKCQRDMLPEYLQMRVRINDDGKIDTGKNNVQTISSPITGNTIRVFGKPISPMLAETMGRGSTSNLPYYDECDFMPYNTTVIKTGAPAFSTASKNAKANGCLYCRLFSSTPGDPLQRDGKTMNEYLSRSITWDDSFYDMPINKLQSKLNNPLNNSTVFIEYQWTQLRLSMKWYEDQCRLLDYDQERILREILLKRIGLSQTSPFKKADLTYIANHEVEPIMKKDYMDTLVPILIYEKLNPKYPYIFAIDPAEGLSGDNTAFTLINPYTLKPAAEYKSPFISPPDMAKLVEMFMDEFCPLSMLLIENNRGRELINRLLETKYAGNIFYDVDKLNTKLVDNTDEYGALRAAAMNRRAWGFSTSSSTRPKLFSVLAQLMMDHKECLSSKYIVEDILALERKPNGRIEAREGSHDDNIISYIMGCYVYYNASNLEDFGIIIGAAPPSDDPRVIEREKYIRAREEFNRLPESVRKFFDEDQFNKPDNDIDRINQYESEIQRYKRASKNVSRNKVEEEEQNWDNMTNDLFENNFSQRNEELDPRWFE